ncbi:MAG: ABC transporter transmembrane domain-containing protein, partial [Janthinobacterium lividum]
MSITLVHEVWIQLFEVSLGIFLLASTVGWVCLMPLLAVILCSKVSISTAGKFAIKQKNWSMAIQKRIAVTSSMLSSMKALKMMGLSKIIEDKVQGIRVWELDIARDFRWLIVGFNTAGNSIGIFAPALTFIAFAVRAKLQGSDSLSTNLAFTSLSLVSLVTTPCLMLMIILPMGASAMACFGRIQKFLLDPSRDDQRFNSSSPPTNGIKLDSTAERNVPPTPDQTTASAITIQNAEIRPSLTADPVLKDINISLDVGKFLMLVGPVGSGKSTLMKAILGEIPVGEGTVSVSSHRMAYCAQTAWLTNESIQQLIIGPIDASEIDPQWYQTVVHACGLEEDIALLPEGDQSIIGSRGLSLSGGQRQRVALARAVYARLDIVLLDDVLSALDAKTEDVVVDRLMGSSGLFRQLNTTVVLITHAVKYFHLADHIVVLDDDSHIAEQGSYEDLNSQSGYISKLEVTEEAKAATESRDHDGQEKVSSKAKGPKGPSEDDVMDLTRKTGDMAVYGYWLKSIGAPSAIMFLSFCAAYSFMVAFPQWWLKRWTEDEGRHMAMYIGVYVALAAGALFFNAATVGSMMIHIGPKAGEALHYRLLRIVMRAPQSYFVETDTGVTLNRFSQDMQLVDRSLPQSAMMIGMQGCKLIAQSVLLFSAETFMACTVPLLVGTIYLLQKVYLHTSRQLRFLDLESRSPVYSHFLETLEGLSTIRAFGWQRQSVATNIERLDISQIPYYMMSCIQRWLNLALDLLIAGLAVIIIALAVTMRGTTSGGQIGIALNVVLVFNSTLRGMIESWTLLEISLGAIARLKTFEATTIPEDLPKETAEPPADWPSAGAIEFTDI